MFPGVASCLGPTSQPPPQALSAHTSASRATPRSTADWWVHGLVVCPEAARSASRARTNQPLLSTATQHQVCSWTPPKYSKIRICVGPRRGPLFFSPQLLCVVSTLDSKMHDGYTPICPAAEDCISLCRGTMHATHKDFRRIIGLEVPVLDVLVFVAVRQCQAADVF